MIKIVFTCDKCGIRIEADQPDDPNKPKNNAGYSHIWPPASIDFKEDERPFMLLCSECKDKWLTYLAMCKSKWTKEVLSFFKADCKKCAYRLFGTSPIRCGYYGYRSALCATENMGGHCENYKK